VQDNNIAIEVEGIWKKFRVYHERNQTLKEIFLRRRKDTYEDFWALREVSFAIPRGITLGIIGENGSGKSTLLKILARILRPDKGSFSVTGKVSTLLELGAGFHPELTGRENIFLNGSILGLNQKEIAAKYDGIVAFSELERFIDTPVKNYSSGMYVRLGFAVAINVQPDVLLIDEVLAVGDEAFQRKCSDKIFEFKSSGKTIVLVSHGLEAIRNICDEVVWIHEGEIKGYGNAGEVVDLYLNQVNEEESRKSGQRLDPTPQGTRVGSLEAEITQVAFSQANGQPTSIFKTNDPFTACISYKAHQEIQNPVFGVAIYRSDGVHITGPNTKVNKQDIDVIVGEGTVEYHVESLPLLPGTYFFSASIYDNACLKAYDHHDKMYSFRVLPGGSDEVHGLTQIPSRWKHTRS
jgi:ABC-type polysaccharide/polyol phosphate transport system ATPase subunit